MARKGENIYKRKDGRWEARYIKGYEISGKIRYGFCYGKSYREAKEKAMKCKAAMARAGSLPTPERHRFAFFCGEWLQMERGRVKESTYVKYDSILKNHILPSLGSCYPQGINTLVVEQFKQELINAEFSEKTVRDILVMLKSILKYTAQQYPGAFPDVEVIYPKEQRKEARVLSLNEQQKLVTCLETDMDACKFGILLAMLTGLRIGELCALRWEHISLRRKTISVEATMQRLRDTDPDGEGKTRIVVGNPKTDTSSRVIPLSDSLVKLCRSQDPHCKSAYVLTGTERIMEPRQLQRKLAKYTRSCGLEGVHFHTIRHTFATRCMEVGFEIKSLSEILGHSSTAITLNLYVHSSMDLKRKNMNKLTLKGV